MSEDNKKQPNPKRIELARLSNLAEELRNQKVKEAKTINEGAYWGSRTINFMLLNHIYDTKGATEFNTFNQWKAQNATVLKGEKAFAIWGQPLRKAESNREETEETEKYKFFPLCYLFSDKQVKLPEDYREQEAPEEKETSTNFVPIIVDDYL